MKILFLTNKSAFFETVFGGAESSIKLIATQLAKLGHSIYYITRDRDKSLKIGIKKYFKDEVIVYAISFLNLFKSFFLVRNIHEHKVKKKLEEVLKNEKINLVYCFYELNNLNMLFELKRKGYKFKIVMRMAGMNWYEECKRDKSLIQVYENIFNKIDSVNFIHEDLKKMTFEVFEKLHMNVDFKHSFCGDIGTSVPIRKNEKSEKEKKRNIFSIMMISRFSAYQKRQDLLVEAMLHVNSNLPIKLFLIGNGSNFNKIKSRVSTLELDQRVIVESFLKQKDVWERMKKGDLLCHATEYEGLGKIIIESMSLGLPVLASDVHPINQYIEDEENGFLVKNDSKSWANKILSIYRNRNKLTEISEKSIKFIDKYYNPSKNVFIYEEAFKKPFDIF